MEYRSVGMFSGGLCSFLACARAKPEVLLFADTGIEDEDLYRFLKEGSELLNIPLVVVSAGISFDDLILKKHALPNNRMPFCSRELKHRPSWEWVRKNAPQADLVFGLDWTETHRIERVKARWPGHRIVAPMADPPYMMKPQMIDEVRKMGIEPPRLYALGFAHNNCGGGCVRAGQAAWMHLYRVMPDRYQEWVEREALIPGHTFLKRMVNRRIVPLRLADLPAKFGEDPQAAFDWGGCGCFLDD